MIPQTSELFEFNKMLFIYIITSFVVFFWLIEMIRNKKIILKKTWLDVPIVLFLLSQVASTILSIDPHTSLFGYYGRFNGGLMSTVCYIILYYGFVSNSIDVFSILKTSLISSLMVILWGLPGKMGHDLTCFFITKNFNNACWSRETNVFDPAARMFSTLGQPDWLGAYLAINFFIGLYFLFKTRENIKLFILNFLYLILNFASILFSRSRSAEGALGISLAVFIIYLIFSNDLKKIKNYLISLFLIMLVPVLLFKTGIESVDKYLSLSSIKRTVVTKPVSQNSAAPNTINTGITDSFAIRKIVWEGALKLGMRYPFFGTGVETFAYSYFFVRPASHNLTSEWDFLYNKAHNEYLNYLATTGFIGLVSYLSIIGVFTFFIIKNIKSKNQKSDLYIALYCAWLTILITNFFGFSTTTVNLFFYLIPAFVIFDQSKTEKKKEEKTNSYQGFLYFILVIVLFYTLYSIGVYFMADLDYAQGLRYSNPKVNDFQKAAYYFQQAIKLRSEHVFEDKFSYSLAYLSGIASYQKNTDMASQLMAAADYYNLKSLKESPKNVLYWKTRAKNKYLFYLVTLDKNELYDGITAFNNAFELSPTDPKIPYGLSVYYSLLYDIEKDPKSKEDLINLAIKNADEAINLKPDFYDGYFLKGQILKKVNRKVEAKKVFEYILNNLNPNDSETKKELETL